MITVLLAVYNGEKYLKEQIESILNQSVKDIKIVIRDDGSSDGSSEIISSYCSKYPDKISCIKGAATGAANKNFAKLLKNCDSDYIMLCDQDDVWLPKKIEKTLDAMRKAESDGKKAILVHTDLKVVNQELVEISPSFFKFQKLIQNNVTLPKLLVQNYVTGCTIMINRALKEKCGEISDKCIMHDWWLALVAVLFGEIVCIEEATMLYRQHSDNQVGAKASYGMAYIKRKLSTLNKVKENYNATYVQAAAILERYGDSLYSDQRKALETYCEIPKMCKLKKIRTINKFGFKKCTLIRVIGQYFLT